MSKKVSVPAAGKHLDVNNGLEDLNGTGCFFLGIYIHHAESETNRDR